MGIYVAIKYTKSSVLKLDQISKLYDIPNPVNSEEYHTTIIYSKGCGEVSLSKNLVYVTLDKFHYFNTFEGKRACVILLSESSPVIWNEHQRMMQQDSRLTYDFPKYLPHITMSYDVPETFKINAKFEKSNSVFLVGEEYAESLKD